MPLHDLPPELVANITSVLASQEVHLGPYATISRQWQSAVERITFRSLCLRSTDLDSFTSLVANSYPHRKAALHTIDFVVVLPAYDDAACARFETDEDRRINNTAFSEALGHLFKVLSSCEDIERARPITLRIQDSFAPMDPSHRGAVKYAADKAAFDTGQRKDLWHHRYEHSYLRLLHAETLPTLRRITSFSLFADTPRFVDPVSVAGLCAKLPKLESADWQLSDGEKKDPLVRTQLREIFARDLRALSLPCAKTLHIGFQHEAPFNERFVNADVRRLGSDTFSAALRLFLQASTASRVILDGPICIGPELFWPSGGSEDGQKWTHLKELLVSFSAVRPDGGWYFDRDPSVSAPPTEEAGGESDDGSGSDYGSDNSDSELQAEQGAPDEYDAEREGQLRGAIPTRSFRTVPTANLERLLEASARAAACMTNLKTMAMGADIQPSERTDFDPQSFEFEFASKGHGNWKDQDSEDVKQPRLYWTVPAGWRMNDELERLWRKIIGQEGIIRYEEW
ncbi:hypothetical protein GGR56DRAFT_618282 [Xylariaceae sp. FL0804]|nr:hypothetical protein GGR56DRAFT_618282 [Xylariaceae sp. FL0804]